MQRIDARGRASDDDYPPINSNLASRRAFVRETLKGIPAVVPAGKLFESGHAVVEAFYPGFKRLRRHRRSCLSPSATQRRTGAREIWRMPCRLPTDDATIVGMSGATGATPLGQVTK